ncbi:MAG: AgmX/PglI C-terminal domain-containing protein, partial [Kofleriaceae bacterium]
SQGHAHALNLRDSGVKEVAVVGTGTASGDLGGLTKEEIDKVVKSRAGLIKACYQKELDKQKGLGGKLVVKFTIAPAGDVTKAAPDNSKSSLQNTAVSDCVVRQIMKLKFPAKGGGVVNYPFIFSQG